jgi:hypothetical protein
MTRSRVFFCGSDSRGAICRLLLSPDQLHKLRLEETVP